MFTKQTFTADQLDFHRDWGTKLLLDSDQAWSDPEYLKELVAFAAPQITNYGGKGQVILDHFNALMNSFFPGQVIRLTITGTAANNLLYEYAEANYTERTHEKPRHIQLLAFDKTYGGTHGRIREVSSSSSRSDLEKETLTIPSPFLHPGQTLSETQRQELVEKENAALAFIEKQVNTPELEIGGVFLEPVSITQGLNTFRPDFLLRLRALCDRLKIPIFADEIMSGGGRTGKFWAFEHFDGFVPDLVTFGKGLVVAGVFQPEVRRHMFQTFGIPTTTQANPLTLLQSMQVLKAIKERNLLANATLMGNYFVERLKQNYNRWFAQLPPQVRPLQGPNQISGLGLMISSDPRLPPRRGQVGFHGRLLPPLTISKEEIDHATP